VQYFLYKVVNSINDKVYIGITNDVKRRFRDHCRPQGSSKSAIRNAINVHGKENFHLQILCIGSKEYCVEIEENAIAAFNSRVPNGYNIAKGGLGACGLTGELNGMYGKVGAQANKKGFFTGKTHSEVTKAKISQAHTGKKRSDDHKEKMRQIALNRSPELLKKMADARRATADAKMKAKEIS